MGGKWVELQKWSSMGNGYTFELETLLFYALCVQFVPHSRLGDVTVFGDDIIVPQEYAPAVIDALTYLGFEVNTKKSHLAGGFFESCGEHYFFGSNVKPFYCRLRDDPDDPDIPYAVKLANRLRAWSSQLLDGCDARYKPIWDWLVEQAPVRWRNIRVPPVLGDLGFACSMGEAELRRPDGPEAYHFGCEGYFVRSISPTTKDVCKGTLGVLLSALAAAGRTSDPNSGRWWGVDNTIPQALSRWDLMIANIHGSVDIGRPSYGRESRRGIYGRLKERWTWVIPWSGYEWVDAPRGASVIS